MWQKKAEHSDKEYMNMFSVLKHSEAKSTPVPSQFNQPGYSHKT